MSHFDKTYSNGEIIVHWKPELCIHSGNCARGLFAVFKPRERPWVRLENGTTEAIIQTVETCPSGALTWEPVASNQTK